MIFRRDYRLIVGDLDLSNLDITFKVKKTLKVEPNTCEIVVYNLAKETRNRLIEFGDYQEVPVMLEAGYFERISQLYFGELRYATTTHNGVESETRLSTQDKGGKGALVKGTAGQNTSKHKHFLTAKLNIPLGPGATAADAFDAIVKALGIKAGNSAQARKLFQTSGVAGIYQEGTVLSGSAADALTNLCRAANCEWSVQGGQIQILNRGAALAAKAVLVSAETGMIGSPKLATDGTVEVDCLLIPELRPGVLVDIQSDEVKGGYRVEHIDYTGDTSGDPWFAKIHGKKY